MIGFGTDPLRAGLIQALGGRERSVESHRAEATRRSARSRKLWLGAFGVSASVLICCLVVTVVNPIVGSISPLIYWLALGSAVLCAVSALRLRSYERFDAADEGAWLSRVGTRNSKHSLDDLDGFDD